MKQIMILSSPNDSSTTKVISWAKILFPSAKIVKSCPADILQCSFSYEIGRKSFVIKQSENIVDLSDVSVIWCRKWYPEEILDEYRMNMPTDGVLSLKNHISQEFRTFFDYLCYRLRDVFWLNHPQYVTPNKLIQLTIAKEIGLTTPTSWILNHYSPQIDAKNCITKPLSNCCDIRINNTIYTSYTSKLTGKESYDDLFISFVQENIPKEAEIRVFYLLGKCYALLIHSQDNKKTQTDYRKYDYKHPNRLEPCLLPPDIESKIDAFMHAMNLQTGSLDFILTPSGEYVFLEVNPCGQYDIFNSCNIYPDKLIAEALISKLKQ